jgi:hypothetical protein
VSPFSRLPLRLSFKVRGVAKPVDVTLATNEKGECELGTLTDVTSLNAECDFLQRRGFQLAAVTHDWPARLHQLSEESLEVPFGASLSQVVFRWWSIAADKPTKTILRR